MPSRLASPSFLPWPAPRRRKMQRPARCTACQRRTRSVPDARHASHRCQGVQAFPPARNALSFTRRSRPAPFRSTTPICRNSTPVPTFNAVFGTIHNPPDLPKTCSGSPLMTGMVGLGRRSDMDGALRCRYQSRTPADRAATGARRKIPIALFLHKRQFP